MHTMIAVRRTEFCPSPPLYVLKCITLQQQMQSPLFFNTIRLCDRYIKYFSNPLQDYDSCIFIICIRKDILLILYPPL